MADSLTFAVASLAHRKRLRHGDIVLAFAALAHHVLLVDQLLFERSLESPSDIIWILILESLRLSSGSVDVLNSESAENDLLAFSQFTTSREVSDEVFPRDPLLLMVSGHSQE